MNRSKGDIGMAKDINRGRREYLKYAGAAAAGAVVAGIGGYYGGTLSAPVKIVEKLVKEKPAISETFNPAIVTSVLKDDRQWGGRVVRLVNYLKETFDLEVPYTDGVPPADWERVIYQYAEKGYNPVCELGGEFVESIHRVAPYFPETQFIFTCVNKTAPNVSTIFYLEEETGYLAGVLAGLMTKTNKVGAIGGYGIPCVNSFLNAFKVGAEEVNPNVQVLLGISGSFTDIAKAKDLAKAMIDLGADFLADYYGNELGILDAVKENPHVLMATFYEPKLDVIPEQDVVTLELDFIPAFLDEIVWKYVYYKDFPQLYPRGYTWWAGLREGYLRPSEFHIAVPEKVQEIFNEKYQTILKKLFTPIRNEQIPPLIA
jgi:basic membrane protein A